MLIHAIFKTCLCLDDFREQLIEDSVFLKADWRLDTELVDKLILQLNRVYPQILTDKEATKVSLQDAKIVTSKFWFTLTTTTTNQTIKESLKHNSHSKHLTFTLMFNCKASSLNVYRNICFLTLNIFTYLFLMFSLETWMCPQVFDWESFLHICKEKEKKHAGSFTELCICT